MQEDLSNGVHKRDAILPTSCDIITIRGMSSWGKKSMAADQCYMLQKCDTSEGLHLFLALFTCSHSATFQ